MATDVDAMDAEPGIFSTTSSVVSGKTKRKMKRFDFPCKNFYTGRVVSVEEHIGEVYCEQLQNTLMFSTCTSTLGESSSIVRKYNYSKT